MRSKIFWIGLIVSSPLIMPAQQSIFPTEKQSTFTTESCFQMWRIKDAFYTISQLSFPLTLYVPFTDNLSLTATHIPAYSQWGSNAKLNGLSDTWVQGTYLSGNEKWMANLGLGIPTGKTKLSENEMLFSQSFLSQNLYRFKLPVYGQGFSVKVGGAFAYPIVKQIVLGLGIQYVAHSAYKPMSYKYTFRSLGHDYDKYIDVKYKQGDEITMQAGLDYRAGENTKFMVDGLFTYYKRDMLENEEVFGSGMKISINAGLYYQYDEHYVWAYLTDRMKGKNELLSGLGFETAEKNLTGDQVEIGVVWNAIILRQGLFHVLADGRFYGRNENRKAGGVLYGGGFSMDIKLSNRVVMTSRLKYLIGKLIDLQPDLTTDYFRSIEGMEVALGLKLGL